MSAWTTSADLIGSKNPSQEDLDCSIIDGLMLDYLQFHIKDLETGVVRIVPEDPSSYGSSQGADFFVQGPILAFSGRLAGYVSQIQPYLAKERDADFGLPGEAGLLSQTSVPRS